MKSAAKALRVFMSFAALGLPSSLALSADAARLAQEGPRIVLVVGGGLRRALDVPGPSFVLYSDRHVIFKARREGASPSGYLSTRLSESKYRALLEAIAPERLMKLGESYDASIATDPALFTIHTWSEGRRKSVSVVGMLIGGLNSPSVRAGYSPPELLSGYDRAREKAPREFIHAYDAISLFDSPAEPWLPPSFEILLMRAQKPSDAALTWPEGWPALSSARVEGRGGYRMHTMLLPASQFATLKRLLPRDGRAAVARIENAYSVFGYRLPFTENGYWEFGYRLPFPHEQAWGK